MSRDIKLSSTNCRALRAICRACELIKRNVAKRLKLMLLFWAKPGLPTLSAYFFIRLLTEKKEAKARI